MMVLLPPGLYLIIGAALLPLVPRGWVRSAWVVALPLIALAQVVNMPQGFIWTYELLEWRLLLVRADALSQSFAYVFGVASLMAAVYALHTRDTLQQSAALAYAGTTLLAVYAGDLVTMFVAWELAAVTSVFLVWARRDAHAYRVGLRYLTLQVTSGLLLLTGIVLLQRDGGALTFEWIGTGDAAGRMILVAFALKGAFPLLHAWLTDAYPEATETGTVFMTILTTKLAMYALVRGFAGVDALLWIGIAGALYALARMAIDNDARRIVCWALLVQLGFITAGVGVGSNAALAGAALHAFAGTFYIALMMMALGAVMRRTGTMRLDRLGGLYRAMPVTAWAFFVGAAALSAVPPFAGYLSKGVLFDAYPQWAYAVSTFVSAGVFIVAGLRLPWVVFFANRSGSASAKRDREPEAPLPMIVAMTAMATVCVLFAIVPGQLLAQLPWQVTPAPWQPGALATQLAVLALAAGAFVLLLKTGRLPPPLPAPPPDVDWLYRRGVPALVFTIIRGLAPLWRGLSDGAVAHGVRLYGAVHRHHGPQGTLARTWPTGSMVLWVAVILAVALVFYYL